MALSGPLLDLRRRGPGRIGERCLGGHRAGELIGYCCFGAPARVPPAIENPGTLDVGYGLAPELMGRALGPAFVGAILDFAFERFAPERLRLYVLDWNERSRKVATGHGFAVESVVDNEQGRFLVMVLPAGG